MLDVNLDRIVLSPKLLKPGSNFPTLFVAPGIGGDPTELAGLIEEMHTNNAIYGIQTTISTSKPSHQDFMNCPRLPTSKNSERHQLLRAHEPTSIDVETSEMSVEHLGDQYMRAIISVQPRGPYALAGYSFGGLAMLEAGRLLYEKGETIALLALLDSFLHERQWPWKSWMTLLFRRAGEHSSALTKMPPGKAIQRISALSGHLADHFRSRGGHVPQYRAGASPAKTSDVATFPNSESSVQALQTLAYARYRPRFYCGKITLLKAASEPRLPKDALDFWRRFVREIEIHEVPGDHRELVTMHADIVATTLERCLQKATTLSVD